jgi:hypothetical protein
MQMVFEGEHAIQFLNIFSISVKDAFQSQPMREKTVAFRAGILEDVNSSQFLEVLPLFLIFDAHNSTSPPSFIP